MIIRHIPMKTARLSSFAGLVEYITDPQDKQERLGKISLTNCNSIDPAWAIKEILATQAKNQRATADKTYHLLISFAPGETLSDNLLNIIEDRVVSSIGFKDHQRISTVHHDTDNLHIHIAINKIHPKTFNMIEPYRAYRTFAEVASQLEIEFGLQIPNHQTRKGRSENLADDMEQHSGIESLINWMKRHCKDQIEAATSWDNLHRILAEHGLTIKLRANGFVFCDKKGLMVKASSVSRNFSKKNLLAKLGEFIPASTQAEAAAQNTYRYEPLNKTLSNSELYARYRDERLNNKTILADRLKTLRTAKTCAIEKAKKRARLKRKALKLMKMPVIQKKILYGQISKILMEEIAKIRNNYSTQRQQQIDGHQNRTWADWLRYKAENGDQDALTAMRSHNRKNKGKYSISGGRADSAAAAFNILDSVTKEGTEIYKFDKTVIRNNGHEIKISKGASIDSLIKALNMARRQYGNCLRVNGSPLFKKIILQIVIQNNLPITFADPDIEAQRIKLKQETNNEHPRRNQSSHGRRTASNDETVGARGRRKRGKTRSKPNPHRARRSAPAENQNGMRDLSQLDVVQFAERGEVLLQDNASDKLERKRGKSHNHL
ncbi:TPA: relaxase/mobilization nuclease domain-containing protein [Legionella pneumophila]|nr:relaxase/mobilization nuclease domain-containing protein [Legionella pneumophila]HAT5916118.1 relaxase/mobilization nuclease domain-containing protein [Legionella pneumophila]HAT7773712.1 relaxase/mobilization nuclease domain-containing protein [Legionella pneumophila]HAT7825287.1 relaxase/mobilization nuclease domain-containing protein [Legionella pneumophila]HAT7918624.1 relaxase/mobilization nuclease domain-containing protein [Legionella pneumophila]